MTSPRQNDIPDRVPNAQVRHAEDTLRLIAGLPAPEGLVPRVQARLATAPPPRSFLMSWGFTGRNNWMYHPVLRGCAAAAIVVLVAGGGWSIYSHVQPSPSAKVIVVPARIGPSSGFSNAGAMRTPDTLNGPVLANPVLAHPAVPAQQNVIAPMPSPQPQTLAPKPKSAAHRKKAAPAPIR